MARQPSDDSTARLMAVSASQPDKPADKKSRGKAGKSPPRASVNKIGNESVPYLPNRGRGRPPGAVNKTTRQLREMILGALDECGGQAYLARAALQYPGAFLTLLGKVLPTTLVGDPNAPLVASLEVSFVRSVAVPAVLEAIALGDD